MIIITTAMISKSKKQLKHGVRIRSSLQHFSMCGKVEESGLVEIIP